MRKLVLAPIVIAVACVLATPAQAHWYHSSWDCYAAGISCADTNLSNAEALKLMQGEYRLNHPYAWSVGAYVWRYKKINDSAWWVAEYNGNPYSSDECLVDLDHVSGVPVRAYFSCTYYGDSPKP